MSNDEKKLIDIQKSVMVGLKNLEGNLWKEVQGELHLQNAEMPFWILLFDDSDISKSHEAFKEIVEPYMNEIEPIQFTVSYTILSEFDEVSVDQLMDNDEILEGSSIGPLGSRPETLPKRENTIFDATSSKK